MFCDLVDSTDKGKAACTPRFNAWRVLAIAFALCLASSQLTWAQSDEQNASDTIDLETIQNLIEQTQLKLNKNLANSDRLQQELKLAELKIAQTATLLNQTDKKLNNTRAELTNLTAEKNAIQTQMTNQQKALASQLKSAYMAGDYDFAKMIFNQDEAGKFERVLTYYQYLNKARQAQIDTFRGLVVALKTVQLELDTQEQQLIGLLSKQSSQSSQLRNQQQQRFETFRALEKQIRNDQARVAQLQQQESDLETAIEQAEIVAQQARQRSDIELLGLTGKERQLNVPTAGNILRLFGKRRQGPVRWKGIVINGKSGAAVNTVSDGVVLYADWLKGFGLVTIVDHGKGYMSVYGRNQALLKNVGDMVQAGDTISLVGTSGGQERAGLYFEIRHKGKALNPSNWLAR
ncbi:MAG: septal ring factor EnvC (AmiA/AmiB activator) [Alphaproteobacteria bacterium]